MALTGPSAPLIGKPLGDQRIEFHRAVRRSQVQHDRLTHIARYVDAPVMLTGLPRVLSPAASGPDGIRLSIRVYLVLSPGVAKSCLLIRLSAEAVNQTSFSTL